MRRLAIASGVIVGLPCAWVVAASALYCELAGKMDLFRFPYWQWVEAEPYWRLSQRMTLFVWGSAAAPTLVVLICLFGLVRHWWTEGRHNPSKTVYGKTEWADRKQMRGRDIAASKHLP